MKTALKLAVCLIFFGVVLEIAVAQESPWPTFRRDTKNTGRSPYTGPASPTLQWTYETNAPIASTPTYGVDGTIYIGSGFFWGSTDSALYAINPDGTLKWKFKAADAIWSSPTIGPDGTIYFGSFDNYVYAVEDHGTQPELRWKTTVNYAVMGSPRLAENGALYVGSLNFYLNTLSSTSGDILWQYKAGWCILSTVAFDDFGHLIFGSKDHGLYSMNDLGNSYEVVWRHPVGEFYDGHLLDASPAIADDGTIYIGSDPYGAFGQVPVMVDTSFFAVNPDGSRKWAFATGDGVETSPAIGQDGTIYFGSYDSCVYAVADNGSEGVLKWKYKTDGPVDASPTIGGDGTIYIGSRDSTMYAFNPDGSIRWTYEADGDIESSASISGDGRVYFGGFDGKVYALGNPGPDLGAVEIFLPEDIQAGLTAIPAVRAKNFRTSSASFEVALVIEDDIGEIYNDVVSVSDLGGNDYIYAIFEPWVVPADIGQIYSITAYTILNEDDNDINNTQLMQTVSVMAEEYLCGDSDGNDIYDILDIIYLVDFKFKGSPPPYPVEASNVNGDDILDILDLVALIDNKFKNGPDPVCSQPAK